MDSFRALTSAAAATLALAALDPVGAAGLPPHVGFVLTTYADTPGSQALLAGQYDAAIAAIHSAHRGTASPDVVSETNACVAYAARNRLREAQVACDAAVAAATRARAHASGIVSRSRQAEDATIAIAYANRAVVHALAHEAVSSAEDLAEAHSLAPQSDFVRRNIAAFRSAGLPAGVPEVIAQQIGD